MKQYLDINMLQYTSAQKEDVKQDENKKPTYNLSQGDIVNILKGYEKYLRYSEIKKLIPGIRDNTEMQLSDGTKLRFVVQDEAIAIEARTPVNESFYCYFTKGTLEQE